METKIGKYVVKHNNSKEFHTLKNEIFGEECYYTQLKTQEPYIIDVGAYIGLSVIYFKNIYPNSKILAIEPNPYARKILKENIFNNRLEDTKVLPYAIDTKDTTRNFYVNTKDNWQSTAGFLENSWNGQVKNNLKIEVGTRKLSKYINQRIDLLKIDTEGMELKILEEIENKLENVQNVIIEYHPKNKRTYSKIINILKKNAFKTMVLKDNKEINKPSYKDLLIIKGEKV